MKYKKSLIFICLLICLFSIASVVASDVNETTIASENQSDECISVENEETMSSESNVDEISVTEENEISASERTFTDLTNDINNCDDELNLISDYKYIKSDSNITNGITINKQIIINGQGHSIDANKLNQILIIKSSNVVIKNIVFKNAYSTTADGGAIFCSGNSFKVINCTFVNNFAYNGGAIYFEGNNGTIIDSKFVDNSVSHYGGAVYLKGYNNSLSNSSFMNCSSKFRYGAVCGASYNSILSNCSFMNCHSVSNGGAVGGFDTLSNCNFLNCYSLRYGGAIASGGNATLFNSSFINCHAVSGGSIDLDGYDNSIYFIDNCIFINSTSVDAEGNHFCGGAISAAIQNLQISNSLFKDCEGKYGGAIYHECQLDTVDVPDPVYGGVELKYFYHDATATFENCEFINNLADVGGAFYEENNGTVIIGCKFINNTANNESGAISIINDYDFISDCIFINNTATNEGAAIKWMGNDGSILSSIFINNIASKDSGIYVGGPNTIIKDSVLISNNQNPIIFTENYVVTANFNWWGNTIFNYNQKPNVSNRINVKNWLFMNFTIDSDSLKVGEIATITYDLTNLITSNGLISKYDAFDLPNINLIMTTDNDLNTTVNIIGGLGESKYVATGIPIGSVTIKYYNIIESFNFNIEKGELELSASESVILNGNLIVTAPNNAEGIVHILINDTEYSSNMVNGKASIPINNLALGRYLATISFESELYTANPFNSYFTIKRSIAANDLIKNQYDNSKFTATFYDFEGNVLKNTKVTFMINGELKNILTDNEGVASLEVNLSPNTYDITSLNPITDETLINKIIINSENSNGNNDNLQPINNNEISIPSLNDGFGIIKLPSDASGTIILDIAGSQYKFQVVQGTVNVNIPKLVNGVYGYIITYSGDAKYSSFTKTGSFTVNKPATKPATKTTLTLKKVKVKKSAKKLYITATLKINGKAVKGKVIKFKFNKKSYKAKTNAKGVAKIKVTKKVLKKLKAGKKVKYQATYGKITKKLTVKVKK